MSQPETGQPAPTQGLRKQLQQSYRQAPWLFWLRAAYFLIVVGVLVFYREIWTPDVLFLIFLGVFVLYGLGKDYLLHFGPFVVLLVSYDSLRSIVPLINSRVHYFPQINFDRWVGHGTLPTAWLQHLLYHGYLTWYDYYFYILYMCHFLTPLIVALLIWRLRPRLYVRYVLGFVLLSYAGFATYVAFPAAPPWMASDLGLIPHIQQISSDVWWALGIHGFPSIYEKLDPNNVAAVPSLHAAYPTLMWLYITQAFGRRWGLALVWYPVSMWVGVVYLGEHYVFDVVLGVIYAAVAFATINALANRYAARARSLRKDWQGRRREPAAALPVTD